jgi:hypothetical protein
VLAEVRPAGGPEFKMTVENGCFKPWRLLRAIVMGTSMWMLCSRYDLSALSSPRSEALDNLWDLQYGLELVIPMSSTRLEAR